MLTEKKLIEKLKLIEALFAGTTETGEKEAAREAAERIKNRLAKIQQTDTPVEYKFTLSNHWSRRLLVALLRRYELKPYRYPRQRHTTVMVKVPASFVDQVLWPEFQEINKTLTQYLNEITSKIISESIFKDDSEAEVRENKALPEV